MSVRVSQGGHSVPDDKVVDRYRRSLALLPRALAHADRAYLFDNSAKAHRFLAEYEAGRLITLTADVPNWLATAVLGPA